MKAMQTNRLITWCLGLGLLFQALPPARAKLNVVATLPDLAALAETIGGDRVQVISLARPTEDPHFVDPKPSLIIKLNRADVLLEGGAELEAGWLSPLLRSARNASILPGAKGHVACNQGVRMLDVPEKLDRSQGDVHASGNPHYLMDPANAGKAAETICEALCRVDDPGCEAYRANLQAFSQALEVKLAEWAGLMAPHQGKHLVSYHDSWTYFSRRFGVKVDVFLEPKPGIPPSPAHLAAVIGVMKEREIRLILVEPFLNRRTADTVARHAQARVLEVSQFPGGMKGGAKDYLGHMDGLVTSMTQVLSGN